MDAAGARKSVVVSLLRCRLYFVDRDNLLQQTTGKHVCEGALEKYKPYQESQSPRE